jgi:hypothetical protein
MNGAALVQSLLKCVEDEGGVGCPADPPPQPAVKVALTGLTEALARKRLPFQARALPQAPSPLAKGRVKLRIVPPSGFFSAQIKP